MAKRAVTCDVDIVPFPDVTEELLLVDMRQRRAVETSALRDGLWERLPDEQERERRDLLEVAADFHQLEVLTWLFRDAGKFEKEVFVGFAIRRHLADALLAVLVDGFRPLWAVKTAAKWAPARDLAFDPSRRAPGRWAAGGLKGRWTRERTGSELGDASEVFEVVLPCGVTAIAGYALRGHAMLHSLTIQPGCVTIEDGMEWNSKSRRYEGAHLSAARRRKLDACAFFACPGLAEVVMPSSAMMVGHDAFLGCSGLTELMIPSSVTTIEGRTFCRCSGLTSL
jgi:hypothetical protein